MDWIKSLSPDSSDDEEPSSNKNEFKGKLSSESCDKTDKNVKSDPGIVETKGSDPHLKPPKNDSKILSDTKNNLLNTVNTEYESTITSVDQNISDDDSNESNNQSIFSLVDSSRKINKYNKITIKTQELNESDLEKLADPTSIRGSTSSSQGLTKSLSRSRNRFFKACEPTQSDEISHNEPCEYVEKVDVNEALDSFNKSNLNMNKLTNEWIYSKMNIKEIKSDDLLAGSEQERLTRNPAFSDERKRFSLTTKLMECDDGQVITTNVARRTQKRKHQINWLAMESQDKEAEILERTAHMRKSKRETQMKYGW